MRAITAVWIFICMAMLLPAPCHARVTGLCSNCHTMHNSQGGTAIQTSGTLNPSLLLATCVGCHSASTDDTITYLTPYLEPGTSSSSTSKTPIVFNITEPTTPLAGGNFFWLTQDPHKGHNVANISPSTSAPPGYTTALEGTTGALDWGNNSLTCAGKYGCHGDRSQATEIKAVSGAHHANGSTVATSYRFLDGIVGVEDTDWEQTKSATDHNFYMGKDRSIETDTASNDGTISYLCAECHGAFHNGSGNISSTFASPWLRHPTDYALPNTGDYAGYDPATLYNPNVPVAWEDPQIPIRSEAVVMCLSCHRAHGSPNSAILRWDYKGWPNSETYGCFTCHTSKD